MRQANPVYDVIYLKISFFNYFHNCLLILSIKCKQKIVCAAGLPKAKTTDGKLKSSHSSYTCFN